MSSSWRSACWALLLLGVAGAERTHPRKALKRRMELIKERHGEGDVLAANAQAQIRKLMAARASRIEGFASTLIPEAGAAAQAAGADRQGHQRSANMR